MATTSVIFMMKGHKLTTISTEREESEEVLDQEIQETISVIIETLVMAHLIEHEALEILKTYEEAIEAHDDNAMNVVEQPLLEDWEFQVQINRPGKAIEFQCFF